MALSTCAIEHPRHASRLRVCHIIPRLEMSGGCGSCRRNKGAQNAVLRTSFGVQRALVRWCTATMQVRSAWRWNQGIATSRRSLVTSHGTARSRSCDIRASPPTGSKCSRHTTEVAAPPMYIEQLHSDQGAECMAFARRGRHISIFATARPRGRAHVPHVAGQSAHAACGIERPDELWL